MSAYQDLIHCHRCTARYDPTTQWWTVSYAYGDTTGLPSFVHGKIPLGHCPICRQPPGPVQPTGSAQAAM